MGKLIIRHGERVTEHVLADHPLVVGRDPQCDLFFADKKLSRRHARFELADDGIRLVDLGSRNGSWVNEERVDERILTSSDAVRLGALTIQVEAEVPAAREDEESTVFLTAESSSNDSRTVVLSSDDLPDVQVSADEPPDHQQPDHQQDDAGTVILSSSSPGAVSEDDSATRILPASDNVGDEDPTLRKPDIETQGAERTIMLQGEAPAPDADTGTVIFRGKTAPPMGSPDDDATPLASPADDADALETHDVAASLPVDVDDESVSPFLPSDFSEARSREPRPSGPSAARFVGLVAAVALLAFVVLAVPLLRTLGNAVAVESSLRGRALVDLLAATNEDALRENRPDALEIERVTREPGVVGAYILDPMGRMLAPRSQASGAAPSLQDLGVDVDVKDIRTFRESSASDGTTVYAVPVRAQGRRLGVAVLHYRAGAAVSTWTAVMLLLGSLLLLMGVGAAVLMARRWTLLPVQELRDDVEALRQGFVESLVEDRPYSDLATIARSFNELTGRHRETVADAASAGDVSETFKPMVDPTLVPDEHEKAEG